MDTMLTMCYLISEIITKQLSKAISEVDHWKALENYGIPALTPSMQVLLISYMIF